MKLIVTKNYINYFRQPQLYRILFELEISWGLYEKMPILEQVPYVQDRLDLYGHLQQQEVLVHHFHLHR